MKSIFTQEPVAFMNAVTGVIEAGIALAVVCGVSLTNAQTGAIMGLVVAIGALVRVMVVRQQVTPLADPKDNDGVSLVSIASVSNTSANPPVVRPAQSIPQHRVG